MFYIFILVSIIIIIIIFIIQKFNNYKDSYINNHKIYDNIMNLIETEQNIKNDSNNLIFFINWPYGFGSAISVYIENALYVKNINSSVICLPYFNTNSSNFKYHDEKYNNSFFQYFKWLKDIDLSGYKVYFVRTTHFTDNFISFILPILSDKTNKLYIDFFCENFEIHKTITDSVYKYFKKIKELNQKIIGIHIRSIAQKREHDNSYLIINLDKRLENIKNEVDKNSIIFIATDVNLYIDKARKIFGKEIYYLPDINRIDSENDSICLLSKYTGLKLGNDILQDCLALGLCDISYVSNSNIPFMTTLLNKNSILKAY